MDQLKIFGETGNENKVTAVSILFGGQVMGTN
jgi:hypothetical protein